MIYSARVDFSKPEKTIKFEPVGHSHYSGKSGEIYPDLSKHTTASDMVEKIVLVLDMQK